MIPLVVAIAAPAVEVVISAVIFNICAELIDAVEISGLIGVDGVRCAATGDFTVAAANFDEGAVAAFVDGNAVAAGTQNSEGKVRRVNFNGFIFVEALHTNVDSTFGQTDLRSAIVKIEERKAGFTSNANGGGAET